MAGAGIGGGGGSLGVDIETGEIQDGAVTLAKMANLDQDKFIGRTTASTGVPETATITAAARTVLDDATVAAMVDTLGGASAQGSGGIVRATSPALTTPNIGTPSAGTLTNCTGLPVAGITASTSTALGVGSLELGHASDTTITRTGAGAIAVEGTAVLLSGGALGTPASGTLTNCTGLPAAAVLAGTLASGMTLTAPVINSPKTTWVYEAHTGDDTLLASETGSVHTNTGAAGLVTLTLPTPAAGLWFIFFTGTSQTFTIAAVAGTTIDQNGATGADASTLSQATFGRGVMLVGTSSTKWVTALFAPAWTLA